MASTLIKNAIIVNEGKSFPGAVVIENDKIADILQDGAFDENIFEIVISEKLSVIGEKLSVRSYQ